MLPNKISERGFHKPSMSKFFTMRALCGVKYSRFNLTSSDANKKHEDQAYLCPFRLQLFFIFCVQSANMALSYVLFTLRFPNDRPVAFYACLFFYINFFFWYILQNYFQIL